MLWLLFLEPPARNPRPRHEEKSSVLSTERKDNTSSGQPRQKIGLQNEECPTLAKTKGARVGHPRLVQRVKDGLPASQKPKTQAHTPCLGHPGVQGR